MAAVTHILVPTDGSAGALKAARFAGELARGLGARVSVVIVHSEDQLLPYAWGAGEWPVLAAEAAVPIDELRTMTEKNATDNELVAAIKAVGELTDGVHVVQRWGHPAEEICRHAVDHDVNLIVMGSRGRAGFARLLLGSVSTQVASHATCPVTIVH